MASGRKRAARIILLVGMHKTGTSSTQDTFFWPMDPGFEYVDWNSGNHFGLFVPLFQDEDKYPIPDDHIFPRRSVFFMARSMLRDIRDGARTC
jgi:hypothetical protein